MGAILLAVICHQQFCPSQKGMGWAYCFWCRFHKCQGYFEIQVSEAMIKNIFVSPDPTLTEKVGVFFFLVKQINHHFTIFYKNNVITFKEKFDE